MARGRKPANRRMKLVKGETRPSRVNDAEPEPPQGAPKLPAHLKGDGRLLEFARDAHGQIVAALEDMKIDSPADFGAIEALAVAYAAHALAIDDLNRNGITRDVYATDQEGERYLVKTIKNPADTVRHEAVQAIRSLGSELGLSPTARSRIKVGERGPKRDPMHEHLDGRA